VSFDFDRTPECSVGVPEAEGIAMITSHTPLLELADHILGLAARTADRPRQIDRYINYFGAAAELAGPGETTAVRLAR
jgi:hypothetical protein